MSPRFSRFRLLITSSLILLILSVLNPIPVSAAIVWNENFEIDTIEQLDDWVLQGYERIGTTRYEVYHGFTIVDGELTAEDVYVPWSIYLSQLRRAIHNSSVAYGT